MKKVLIDLSYEIQHPHGQQEDDRGVFPINDALALGFLFSGSVDDDGV